MMKYLLFIIILLFSSPVGAATQTIRYVDINLVADCTTGNYSIANRACNGSDGDAYNLLQDVDNLMDQNDITYVRGGTYTSVTDYFQTAYSGTASEPIILKACPTAVCGSDETPIFRAARGDHAGAGYDWYVVWLKHNYWVVDGLHLIPTDTGNLAANGIYVSGDYNEVKNNTIDGYVESTPGYDICGSGENDRWNFMINVHVYYGDYNRIHDNELYRAGPTDSPAGCGQNVMIKGNYNAVYGNTVAYGGHDTLAIYDGHHNEIYGNTITYAQGYLYTQSGVENPNIIHGNIISGVDWALGYGKIGIYLKGDDAIVRYNIVWADGTESSNATAFGLGGNYASDNTLYNNVFYGQPASGMRIERTAATMSGNLFLNNVWAKNRQILDTWYRNEIFCANNLSPFPDCFAGSQIGTFAYNFIMAYNGGAWQDDDDSVHYRFIEGTEESVSYMESTYSQFEDNQINSFSECSGDSNPDFTDPSTGDFTLQSDSCLIDAGRYLTQVNDVDGCDASSEDCTSLVVDGARFFWFSVWPIGTGTGDQILVNNVSTTITEINYGTNTLTISPEVSWSDGDNIFLFKSFSDPETILFSGDGVDIGAIERQQQTVPGVGFSGVSTGG